MRFPESVLYIAMLAAWVCGIATAIIKGSAGVILFSILVPPVAWVILAIRYLP